MDVDSAFVCVCARVRARASVREAVCVCENVHAHNEHPVRSGDMCEHKYAVHVLLVGLDALCMMQYTGARL